MDFLKKNYEKVLLGVVLLGLLVAIVLLFFKIQNEKQELADMRVTLTPPRKEMEGLKLGREEAVLKQLQSKITLDLVPPHNLVNPVQWLKDRSGRPIKQETVREIGPEAVKVVRIQPLYLILAYDSKTPLGYLINVERQAAPRQSDRGRGQQALELNTRKGTFKLAEIKGSPDNPTELVLELTDSGKVVHLVPPREYKEIEGYKADLVYDPEKRNLPAKEYRKNDMIVVEGERYSVVAISDVDVTLSAQSNQKRTTIRVESGSVTP